MWASPSWMKGKVHSSTETWWIYPWDSTGDVLTCITFVLFVVIMVLITEYITLFSHIPQLYSALHEHV